MPQVIEFPPLGAGADLRQTVASLVEVCKQTVEGEPLRALRTRLRGVGLWDRDRPVPILRLLGVGGDPVVARSPFMIKLGDAGTEDEQLDTLGDRLFELNPPLFKASLEQVAQRPLPKDELYRHISSFAYAGSVPSRPDFETWLQLALVVGALRQVGVAMLPGPRAERFTLAMREIDVEEYLAADPPLAELVLPGDDAAPEAAAAADTAAVVAATATGAGSPLPAALRHLGAATLAQPRGQGPAVPTSRFAGGFSGELRDETAQRIATWWAAAKVPSRAHTPAEFGLDPEAWVERADEVLYRIAVAAALAFRLDIDPDGVVRAYRALDGAGVLADLYHGTVPAELPAQVDARALMLASLAARRCAEAPELAASLDAQADAAGAFAALDAALGRGLFRIELLWILRMLGRLGVVRWDDLPDYTALPFRLVRDTLFRLGFVDSPYAPDAEALTAAALATRRAAGGATDPADEVVAAFAIAAGCAYDCPHRKTCDVACRERLE